MIAGRGGDGRLIIFGAALIAAEEERIGRRSVSASSERVTSSMRAEVRLFKTWE